MEKLSDSAIWVAGYSCGDDNDVNYRYWFTATDNGELHINREITRECD